MGVARKAGRRRCPWTGGCSTRGEMGGASLSHPSRELDGEEGGGGRGGDGRSWERRVR
jgi:hypothetical protein